MYNGLAFSNINLASGVLFAICSIPNCLKESKACAKTINEARSFTCPTCWHVCYSENEFFRQSVQTEHALYSSSLPLFLSSDQSEFCFQWYTFMAKKFDGGRLTHSRRCGRVTRLINLIVCYPVRSIRSRVMRSVTSVYMYMYMSQKSLICRLPRQKYPEKRSWSFLFALRHRECAARLPVHSRSSTTPVPLLKLVCPFKGCRDPGVHTRVHWDWLVGVLLHLPQCWLDEWATTTVCCWRL